MPVADASSAIGKSREYLYRGLRQGRFPGAKFGRSRVIRRAFIEGFLAANAAGRSISFEDFATEWTASGARAVAS